MSRAYPVTEKVRNTINDFMGVSFVPQESVGRNFRASEGNSMIMLELSSVRPYSTTDRQHIGLEGHVFRFGLCQREKFRGRLQKVIPACNDWHDEVGMFDSERIKVLSEALFPGFLPDREWAASHNASIQAIRRQLNSQK